MLSHKVLCETLSYDAGTGVFTWLVARGRVKTGSTAGTKSNGYIWIRVASQRRSGHRLAWFYTYGSWPGGDIDHINGVRDDNRIANLREVARRQNSENMRRPMSNNKSGYLGVSLHRCGRYVSYIRVNGVKKFLGLFDDPATASAAYVAAKRELHPGCTI